MVLFSSPMTFSQVESLLIQIEKKNGKAKEEVYLALSSLKKACARPCTASARRAVKRLCQALSSCFSYITLFKQLEMHCKHCHAYSPREGWDLLLENTQQELIAPSQKFIRELLISSSKVQNLANYILSLKPRCEVFNIEKSFYPLFPIVR